MKQLLIRLSLIVSLLLPVYFLVAALGVKFGLWPWQTGLLVLIVKFGLPLIGIALLLGIVALAVAVFQKPRRGWAMALVGLLIPALALGYLASVRAKSADIPPIHDIATDIADPPTFSAALMATRQAGGANPVNAMTAPIGTLKAYQGPAFGRIAAKTLGQVGHENYPGVRTFSVKAPPAQAYAAAEAEARAQGWSLVTTQPDQGMVEATAETFWFGFKDDVAIRIRPAGFGGSMIDVRSVSRVGLSDLGANAARIEAFLGGLKTRLAAS